MSVKLECNKMRLLTSEGCVDGKNVVLSFVFLLCRRTESTSPRIAGALVSFKV